MIFKMPLALFVSTLFSATLQAQEIVKKEPPAGNLKRGMYVYVDNGKCPKGQLLQVSAGTFGAGGGGKGVGQTRERKCVPHP
jgi:hypothetical protein